MRITLLLLVSLLLTNCQATRSNVGATLGATTTTSACVSMGIDNPYAVAACAVTGAFTGAEIMYNSDYDVHNATFVDHLNHGPSALVVIRIGLIKRQVIVVSYIRQDHITRVLSNVKITVRLLIYLTDGLL